MSGTRIRPDKQIQTAPGQGYTLFSDTNGELQFALLSSLFPPGDGTVNDAFVRGDIRSIDSLQLQGNILVLKYTDNTGAHFTKTCDLTALKGPVDWTDEFINLATGNTVQLTYTPVYPFPLHVYRNGLRQKELYEWRYNPANPKVVTLQGASFGANGQPELVIVDYMTAEQTTPRPPLEDAPQDPPNQGHPTDPPQK